LVDISLSTVSHFLLSQLEHHPKSTPGEVPGDVGVGTSDATATTFQATLIHDIYVILFPDVDLCRAEDGAGLSVFLKAFQAD